LTKDAAARAEKTGAEASAGREILPEVREKTLSVPNRADPQEMKRECFQVLEKVWTIGQIIA
jgi:hypothetical protein